MFGLIKKVRALFSKGKLNEAELKHQREVILNSGFFDENFYNSQCINNLDSKPEGVDLVEHYITIGAAQGLKPSMEFSSSWYIESNEDVRQSGMNPLLHFALYGEEEGRSPIPEQHDVDGFSSPDLCNQKLWSGFSNQVIPKLENFCTQGRKWQQMQSLWHLSRWKYVHGEPGSALALLKELGANQKNLREKVVVGQAKCLLVLGKLSELMDLFSKIESRLGAGEALPYIQANIKLGHQGNESGWLENVNSLFSSVGLQKIRKRDSRFPLTLENIAPSQSSMKSNSPLGESPKVSVIIPTYNAADTIHIALNSLIEQTWSNLEIIVVDDASTDGTAAAVQKFCEQYDYIKYFINETNLGAYPTRNFGYQNCSGQFITVHDSDDWSHPQKIEKQMETLLENSSVVASLTNWVRVNQALSFVGPWLLTEEFVEKNHSSALIRREAIEKIGAWDPVSVGADTEFLWRLEKCYGADSIVSVLPKVPFSFALALETSLTQNKATHVKTIHYGLRRIYRESVAWWHDTESGDLYMDTLKHNFPCPLGNKRLAPNEFDVLIAGDFSNFNQDLPKLLSTAEEKSLSFSVALYHWPDYRQFDNGKIAPEVFSLCMKIGLSFTHAGYQLSAKKICLFDAGLLDWAPDNMPVVAGIENVEVLEQSSSVSDQAKLQNLFSINV